MADRDARPGRAVVTGGTRGIGAATSRRLAATGWEVIALARTPIALDDLDVVACDVTDDDRVADTFARLEPVDLLVNNAGIASSNRIERTSRRDWDEVMAVNATGPFLCSRAVVPGMRERGRGHVVTVASTAGLDGAPYITAYCASKHAAIGLTRALAAELAGTGVAASAVCPTYVETDLTQATLATIRERTGVDEEQARALLRDQTPNGRILAPEEVADAILGLVEDPDANGRLITLD